MSHIKITHNAGFFSCCTIRLRSIIDFYNYNKIIPVVDSSEQWIHYKDSSEDITNRFFKTLENEITDENFILFSTSEKEDQYSDYSKINFEQVNFFIKKFFSPSEEISSMIEYFEKKYSLNHENIISVLYRGNDKVTETPIPTYEEVFDKVYEIYMKNSDSKILIQSDEKEFYDFMISKFPNSIVFDEVLKINKNTSTAIQYNTPVGERTINAQKFLAILIIISKTKHLIINSGNVGMWACLFRNSTENVHQFLNDEYLKY